jgi:hypothetical protein
MHASKCNIRGRLQSNKPDQKLSLAAIQMTNDA